MKKSIESTPSLYEQEAKRIIDLMENADPDSKTYESLAHSLEALAKAQAEETKTLSMTANGKSSEKSAIWSFWGTVAGGVIGAIAGCAQLLMVIRAEDLCKFMSGKAMPFVRHIK